MENIQEWKNLRPFDMWVQSNIPTVFGDEMTYYEKLCKVIQLLNDTMTDVNLLHTEFIALNSLFDKLKLYVDNYFENLDVQNEIDTKLDDMVESGDFDIILNTYLNSWINAVLYGFDNTGKKNNDGIMSNYMLEGNGRPLYFPNGTYNFSSSFNFINDIQLILDNKAELKYVGDNTEYFIGIRAYSNANDYLNKVRISGGIINANNKAQCAIGFNKCRRATLENCRIINTLKYGIKTSLANTVDGDVRIINCFLENEFDVEEIATTGTYGIYNNGFDNFFESITILNFQYAIYTVSGNFSNIQAWIRSKNLVANSAFGYISGYQNSFIGCWIDTYQFGFWTSIQNYGAIIDNIICIINSNVYTPEMQQAYQPVFLHQPNNFPTNYHITNVGILPQIKFYDYNLGTTNEVSGVYTYSSQDNYKTGFQNEPLTYPISPNKGTGRLNRIIKWSSREEWIDCDVTFEDGEIAPILLGNAPSAWLNLSCIGHVLTSDNEWKPCLITFTGTINVEYTGTVKRVIINNAIVNKS